MKKKILITGSQGFIGKNLTLKLASTNNVYGTFYKKKKNNIKNVKFFKCDVRNKKKVKQLLHKIKPDIIFHLAAKSHPTFSFNNPIETMNTNVMGTINILEACKILKLKSKIIVACSSAQFGKKNFNELPVKEVSKQSPEHIYGLSKLVQEKISLQYFKMYNLYICNAIIFNTSGYGKNFDVFQDLSKQVLNQTKKKIIKLNVGNIDNQRDFLHVNDTVNALELIANKGENGQSYIISSGKLTKIKKILDYINKITKKKIIIKPKSKLFRRYDEKNILGNSNKLKKLGWRPKFTVFDIVKDIINDQK